MSFMVHFSDFDRGKGDYSLCGRPLKPYTVGNGQICELCAELLKERNATPRKRGKR